MREFNSLAAFSMHLVKAAIAVRVAEHLALDRAAEIIEKDAKRQLGTYQPEAGPFAAWAPLAAATVADRIAKGFTPDDPLLRDGTLRDSISRTVEGHEAAIGSTSDIAVYQELGTEKIPPRPFLGPAAFNNREAVEKVLAQYVLGALEYGAVGSFAALPEPD